MTPWFTNLQSSDLDCLECLSAPSIDHPRTRGGKEKGIEKVQKKEIGRQPRYLNNTHAGSVGVKARLACLPYGS